MDFWVVMVTFVCVIVMVIVSWLALLVLVCVTLLACSLMESLNDWSLLLLGSGACPCMSGVSGS